MPLPATVLRQLSGPLQIAPAVPALPIDKLVTVVTPVLAALPSATVLGLVGAVVSALPSASALGLIAAVLGGGGARVGAVAGTGAARPNSTTTTRPTTTTTLAPVVMAAAPARATGAGAVGSRCAAARTDVEAAGLVLPAQFEYRCPAAPSSSPATGSTGAQPAP